MTKLAGATTLFRVVKIKTDCAEVQEHFIILSVWRLKQQMQFTVDKGKVMNTGKSNSSCTHRIMGSKLAITMEEDLRVTVNSPSKTSARDSVEVKKATRAL